MMLTHSMDLIGVREIRVASTRDEVVFAPGELPLGGGTWLFSEAQPGVTGLVDLTSLGWDPITITDDTLIVSATCTIAELSRLPTRDDWLAHPLINQCINSLLASFKIWNIATVGGNICTSLPAGPLISLAATLDATAVIWAAGPSGDRRMPVAQFVLGDRRNELAPGEVLRAIEIPLDHLRARTGFRRIALSPLGRTGTLVTARVDAGGETVFTVTGGTTRPRQLRFDEMPSEAALASSVNTITEWFTDAHGAADWRKAMSALFAEELRVELGGTVEDSSALKGSVSSGTALGGTALGGTALDGTALDGTA
jgi:CO/xanthine dehydrogenase FAD-binding subunit